MSGLSDWFAKRWAQRQMSDMDSAARMERGEYLPGDVTNGYTLSKGGVWQTINSPFSNLAKWLSLASLILTPLVIVALVLAAVGQSKNESQANGAMMFAGILTAIYLVIFVAIMSSSGY